MTSDLIQKARDLRQRKHRPNLCSGTCYAPNACAIQSFEDNIQSHHLSLTLPATRKCWSLKSMVVITIICLKTTS